MIRVYENGDLDLAQRLQMVDPFQLAQPLWINPRLVFESLPPEIVNTRPTKEQLQRRDIEKIMAIRFVEESKTPDRLHARGTISRTNEYRETLDAIKNIPAGKSIVVTLEDSKLLEGKKPETTFAYTIRRYLAAHDIAATAYQSGKNEVVVRRDVAGAASKKRKK